MASRRQEPDYRMSAALLASWGRHPQAKKQSLRLRKAYGIGVVGPRGVAGADEIAKEQGEMPHHTASWGRGRLSPHSEPSYCPIPGLLLPLPLLLAAGGRENGRVFSL